MKTNAMRLAERKKTADRIYSRIYRNPNTAEARDTFYDFVISTSVSTTVSSQSILGGMLNPSGILSLAPQRAHVVVQGTVPYFYQKLHITHIDYSVRYLGSQSNVIVAADLYNTVRSSLWISGLSSGTTPIVRLVGVDTGVRTQAVERVLTDDIIPLSSTAFDSVSSYNVPANVIRRKNVIVDRIFDVYSSTTTGSAWATQEMDIIWDMVSDSSVLPNPQVYTNLRVHFNFLDY